MTMNKRFIRWLGRKAREQASASTAPPPPTPPPAQTIRPEDYVGSDEAKNEQVVREGFVAKAKQFLGRLPMGAEVVAMYFCMLDPKTPLWVKGTAAAALAYFILPLDAVPDLLPLVGLSDDVTVLTAALSAISAFVTDEHRRKAREWMAHEHLFAPTS
jgi:uncharacterized membrane protein YkvA (DUF1232 family)